MATTTIEILVVPALDEIGYDAADPYRYGWRYIERQREDGSIVVDHVPLTLADVLHPQEDDHVTHSQAHQRRRRYLCDVLEERLAGDPTAVVLDDVRVAWNVPDLEPHGPDITVVLGVRERKNWSTFNVADEGVLPAILIEITSPSTAVLDRSVKLEEYELAGVPLYIIVDTVGRRRQPVLRLLGYTLTPDGYQQLSANEHGWLWLAPVRVWLGVQGNEIVCYDEDGQALGDYLALASALAEEARARQVAEQAQQAAEQAQHAAEQARQAAEQAQYAAEQARQVAEQAQHAADVARQAAEQRASQAEERARLERQAREAAEARLRALEAGRG